MDDFQSVTDRFLTWFKDSGGVFRDDLLEIKDLRSKGAGRGIIAKQDIAEDTTLFSIPRDMIINAQTSQLTQKIPEIFEEPEENGDDEEEEVEPLGSWGTLILVMMYEYLQGDASKWKPYLDILPQTFDTPIFWSDAERKELEGTALTKEKIGKEESDAMLRSRILPVIAQHVDTFYPAGAPQLNEEELLSLAHRMGSTIMSYAFDLEGDDEQPEEDEDGWLEDREGKTLLGMVPMADMLNANAEFNAHLSHGDQLEVSSLRESIPAGSEILNYYGPLPSSDLLRRYGYVTPEHSRYDIVELPWVLVREALAKELQLSQTLIEKIEAEIDSHPETDLEDVFVIERDSGEPSSHGTFTQPPVLHEVSPELEEQVMLFMKIFKKLNGKKKLKLKRTRGDEIYNAVLNKALRARFAQYPHSIEQDEELLNQDNLSKRHRMAIQVRLGEKRLLQEALALVPDDEGTAQEDEGRATKKARRGSPA